MEHSFFVLLIFFTSFSALELSEAKNQYKKQRILYSTLVATSLYIFKGKSTGHKLFETRQNDIQKESKHKNTTHQTPVFCYTQSHIAASIENVYFEKLIEVDLSSSLAVQLLFRVFANS